MVPDQRVVVEQGVGEGEGAVVQGSGDGALGDGAIGGDGAQGVRLVGAEGDAVVLARSAIGERPGEGGVEAEAGGHVHGARIADRHFDRERRVRDGEADVEGEVEGIVGACLVVGDEAEERGILGVFDQGEGQVAGEAVLLHRIGAAADADRLVGRLADDGKQDGRAAGPPARIGVGHQLAALRVGER